ncbi:MAG: hypothetical protein HRU38_02205 [Saccharospirillaceae bacterium]|nr:hypothetical protein [Pseudomonadales bacterium]NRB77472.1 hypothetical protein [Saccharospirillaceae bacterium]
MMFKTLRFIVVFFVLIISITSFAHAKTVITIAAIESSINSWYEFKSNSKVAPEKIQHIIGANKRFIADMVILTQAFDKADYDFEIEFVIAPNVKRAVLMLVSGDAVMVGSDLFLNDYPASVLISEAIIEEGDIFKGVFGLTSNKNLMAVKSIEDLQQLTAVSLPNWKTDWSTLTKLHVKNLSPVNKYQAMINLIVFRNIDFGLIEIPLLTDPTSTWMYKGVSLSIVSEIKLQMPGSRHFAVSKTHPLGEQVYKALEQGLLILREENKIQSLMEDVGVHNKKTYGWKILN